MTYRGPFSGSTYDGQNGQQWPQQPMQNGFEAYGNPQFQQQRQQYQQYQNVAFAPIGYPQMQNPNFAAAQTNQFQTYEPPFDQRPRQASQHIAGYGANMGQHFSSGQDPSYQTMQIPSQQFDQQLRHRQSAPQLYRPQQHQQPAQRMTNWQQMPPPIPSSMPSYQTVPQQIPQPQYRPVPQQQQAPQVPSFQTQPQRMSSPRVVGTHVNSPRLNSPMALQSPQFAQQVVSNPNPSRNNRSIVANGRIEKSSRISASPRLSTHSLTRSPSVSSMRSPVPAPGLLPHHKDTSSLLVCIAEELFAKARKEVSNVAESMDTQIVQEYQKLVATGLACLETVLNSHKLGTRLEAKLQLRYASILCEETNNVMQAETALTKGITLCEKYRFTDLKYLMQFLQLKMLSQRKGKAAMLAIDRAISDAELLKHVQWVYALRFFKASLYLQSANPSDVHALENLRAITMMAVQRDDNVLIVFASLLEGLSLLKSMKDDTVLRIQDRIAQAQKYQLDASIHIPQLDILALILDFACSLHQKSPQMIAQKLKMLQARMDASLRDDSWQVSVEEILLPIRRQPSNLKIVSDETVAILRPGGDNDSCDYLVMSLWSKIEAFVVTYTYSGLGLLYESPRNDERMFQLWNEALKQLVTSADKIRGQPTSLQNAMHNAEWRREFKCYLQILRGLQLAQHCRWKEVLKCVEELESIVKPPLDGIVGLYTVYLSAVCKQGRGEFALADSIYRSPVFRLDEQGGVQAPGNQAKTEVKLLAAFNRIWIMQHPDHRDDQMTWQLRDEIRPYCEDHPNPEIRTAWHLLEAAIETEKPAPMIETKAHLSAALNGAKSICDTHLLSIALNLMRVKLFQNIVGDQALKSAKAGALQAKRSKNVLWMSVSEGLLAQSYEVQGQLMEAQQSWNAGAVLASKAFES